MHYGIRTAQSRSFPEPQLATMGLYMNKEELLTNFLMTLNQMIMAILVLSIILNVTLFFYQAGRLLQELLLNHVVLRNRGSLQKNRAQKIKI